jgi:hypothetical protein
VNIYYYRSNSENNDQLFDIKLTGLKYYDKDVFLKQPVSKLCHSELFMLWIILLAYTAKITKKSFITSYIT